MTEKLQNGEQEVQQEDFASIEEIINEIEKLYKQKGFSEQHHRYILKVIRSYTGNAEIGILKPEDLAQNVIKLMLNGNRNWNRAKAPIFRDWFYMTTLSYVRNEMKRKEKLNIIPGYEEDTSNSEKDDETRKRRKTPKNELLNEKEMIEFDYLNGCKSRFDLLSERLMDTLNDDEEAYFVCEAIMVHGKKNKSIAEELGITAEEVAVIKKRIRRRISKELIRLN